MADPGSKSPVKDTVLAFFIQGPMRKLWYAPNGNQSNFGDGTNKNWGITNNIFSFHGYGYTDDGHGYTDDNEDSALFTVRG